MEKFKVNDRVRRIPYTVTLANEAGVAALDGVEGETQVTSYITRGCMGTVKSLRQETTSSSAQARPNAVMVQVLWDNGTLSYLGPEGIEAAK